MKAKKIQLKLMTKKEIDNLKPKWCKPSKFDFNEAKNNNNPS